MYVLTTLNCHVNDNAPYWYFSIRSIPYKARVFRAAGRTDLGQAVEALLP